MSLCGTIVVVEKKKKKKKRRKDNRKRKSIDNGGNLSDNDDDFDNDDNDDDDSTSPLSYTYTNCDSITILQEQEQLLQQQQQQEEQELSLIYNAQTTTNMGNAAIHSTYNNNEDDDDQSTIGSDQPPIFRWLNWRMDPIKSFSDWTIDVVIATPNRRKSSNGTTTINRSTATTSTTTVSDIPPHATSVQRYHVHRNVLVVESQFFQSLLYSHQREQSDTNITNSTSLNTTATTTTTTTTIVTLNDIYEANVFPTFLDYMYSPGHVWITQQNAITMLLFAKNFGMKRLQWLTKQFLKRNHEINTIQHCQQQGSDGIRTKPNMTNSNNVINISKKSTFKDRMNNLSKVVVTATNIQSSPTMSMVQTTTTTIEPSLCDMLLTDTISSPIDYTIRYNNHINHNTQLTFHNNDNDNNNNMYSPIPVSTTTTSMNTTNFQKQQHHHQQQQHNNYDVSAATNASTTGYL